MALKEYIRRIKGMSLDRMFTNVDTIHDLYGKNKLITTADMIYSLLKYGTGYQDYNVFGYAVIHGKNRATFVNNSMSRELCRLANNREYMHFFKDKAEFCETFREFIGRDFINLNKCSETEFLEFLEGKTVIFAKKPDTFGGEGVRCIHLDEPSDGLLDSLKSENFNLCEDRIIQHPVMQKLHPDCVNSIRMTTLVGKDGPHFLYSLMRIGASDKPIDNICGGGLYLLLDGEGRSISKAFSEKTNEYFDKHPISGVDFESFVVPYHRETVEMVKKAAMKVPQVGYIGWDVAITENGPVLIEGNVLPGYDMCQNTNLSKENHGLLPTIRSIPGYENIGR